MKRAALLIALCMLAACGRYLHSDAAVVEGLHISVAQLEKRVDAALKTSQTDRVGTERQVLVQMIQDRLIDHEAERRHFVITDRDIDARLSQIRQQFPSQDAFNQALTQQGIDPSTIRDTLRRSIIAGRIRDQLAPAITEADLRRAYGTGSQFKQAHVRHILFRVQPGANPAAALAKAKAALKRIRGGEDFAAVAKQVSEDAGSKASGGDLGFISAGQTIPEFERVAFSLKIGQVSEPTLTQFGYHLIQVLAVKHKTFAEVRSQLLDQEKQRVGQAAFGDYLRRVLRSAEIEVNPRFGDFDPLSLTIEPRRFFVPVATPSASLPPIGDLTQP